MVLDSVTIKAKYDANEMGYDECLARLVRIGYSERAADNILVPLKPAKVKGASKKKT